VREQKELLTFEPGDRIIFSSYTDLSVRIVTKITPQRVYLKIGKTFDDCWPKWIERGPYRPSFLEGPVTEEQVKAIKRAWKRRGDKTAEHRQESRSRIDAETAKFNEYVKELMASA